MPTPHINANNGDFAKVVLMPGDPKRAAWIAENFLHDVKLVAEVRGMTAFTGYTKNGKRISVVPSGMGMPSIGIYSHELFESFGVEAIIRVGTCGSYSGDAKVGDIIFAQGACTDSNWMGQYQLNGGTYSAIADFDLLLAGVENAKALNHRWHCGNVLSADVFYDYDPNTWKKWAALGVLCAEMEAYALYCNAVTMGKKALAMFTVSDSFVTGEKLTAEQRQTGLGNMIETAIMAAERFID